MVWGSLLEREPSLRGWLGANGFAPEAEVADSLWTEGPYGLETHSRFLIFVRPRAGPGAA